ncbi:hypothetical protein Acy02nite_40190 [Actinoplanes cyaneus]|uniref:NACHT domain-containing protein n=1 Tax=Actinoplanes cyaneus TaxID=52696 RepID=A0A919IIK9_9ACTN|nr:SAV_2336 N-terminal domain-related protein [Actinoplanes cyaneus]MCW2139606.1 hypothetical protein [Actinoplanes cyaneus]GID66138.1 hypothetical protein Acy02nite_40190 [Actinoplanes cyaneus]
MTAPIDRWLAILRAAGMDLTPAEAAEALWLAMQVELSPAASEADGPAPAGPLSGESGAPDGRVDLRLPVPPVPPVPDREAEPPAVVTTADGTQEHVTFAGAAGRPLRVPTARALPHSGRTMYALRPLKRRLPSTRQVVIDEGATARQIAERGIWTPVWRPAPERWLHLTLLLDDSSVPGIWHQLGREVSVLLERLGAFRTMRVLHLGLDAAGRPGVVRPAGARPSLKRLAERPGDHLLLVLSDGIGEPWHDGRMSGLLALWSRRASVAILQPLPERLWSRTGLAPRAGRLFAPRAGAPASAYTFRPVMRRRRPAGGSVPVPILEIDPRWLSTWSRLVAGRAPGGIDAVVTPAGAAPRTRRPVQQAPGLPAARRVRDFRAGASPEAADLARYLSVVRPLNLAVMRLLQAVMLPGSGLAHLSEVLCGGLLKPISELSGRSADEQHFTFLPGVRHALRAHGETDDPSRVYEEVSAYLERHPERTGVLFTALATMPVDEPGETGAAEPFASIGTDVLRRFISGLNGGGRPLGPTRNRLTILHLREPVSDADLPEGVAPDLIVVTGSVARRATSPEYRTAYERLAELSAGLELPPGRIVVTPGLTDVNEGLCLAYFLERSADGLEPIPPYWPKWEPFAAMTKNLPGGSAFQPHQPWQMYEIPKLRTVVAALNSTVPVSHLPGERDAGGLGEAQLTWFADRLRDYEDRGWLRIGVVHHDTAELAVLAPHLDVVLHGQGGGVRELGLTGVPAIGTPDRAQVVDLRPGALRVGGVTHEFGNHWWLAEEGPPPPPKAADNPTDPSRTDLLARVAQAYRLRHPDVPLVERRWQSSPDGYLVASPGAERHCIGVFDGEPTAGLVERFRDEVVRREGRVRDATLVCRVMPVDPAVRDRGADRGIRVIDFADFQLGDDLLRFAEAQAARLGDDPAFTPGLYVPPLYTLRPETPGDGDLLELVRSRLAEATGGFVWLTGAGGTGKTFLLRELARRMHAGHDPLLPVLIDLRSFEQAYSLDELVAIQFFRHGLRRFNLDEFRYLRREGRVVLLLDGLQEQVARALDAVLRVAGEHTAIVVASRGPDLPAVALDADPLVVRLTGFDDARIADFLTRRLGSRRRAEARRNLLGRIDGLVGMVGNPRLLALLAGVPQDRLRAATDVPALYREMVGEWLEQPGDRDPSSQRWQAVTLLARRLWETGERALGADVLGSTADVLARLAGPGAPLLRDPDRRFRFADPSVLGWLVAREIAGRLELGPRSGGLRVLLGRELSPLMVEFLADLAGRDRVRAWAAEALADPESPEEIRAAARRMLDHPV